jgi:divalent metal cation (Fe/Co/Zn/Cd) transporter
MTEAKGLLKAAWNLVVLVLAGVVGYAGNFLAARIRLSAGRRLDSPALIADGNHARAVALTRE